MSEAWSGVIPPLTTPFEPDGALSLDRFEENLARYLEFDLSGFLVLGSTGEAIHLERRERVDLVRAAARALPADRSLLVGVSEPSSRQALVFLEELDQLPIDGVLVSTPHYYRNHTSRKGLLRFYTEIAEASPFRLLLYNFPQCTGIDLAPDLVAELAGHPNIAGIKESSGNIVYLQKLLAASAGQDFQVLSGSAEVVLPAWQLGVRAGIYAAACVRPELLLTLVEEFLTGGPETQQLQSELFEFSATVVAGTGIPGIKYAMDLRGWSGGPPRLPLLPPDEDVRRRIDAAMAAALISR